MISLNRRRLPLVTGIAFVILVLWLFYRDGADPASFRPPSRASKHSSCPALPPPIPYVPTKHDRFDWKTIVIHNPLETLISLPREHPQPLRRVQYDFRQNPHSWVASHEQRKRQKEVKRVFEKSWKSYCQRAWLKDELAPVSGGSKNTFGGWAATLVDSLDTLWILGLREEFERAVAAIGSLDFGPDNPEVKTTISVFETNIRYLGGLLSAYDLTDCKDKRLLDKAVEVGDMLFAAFDTENHMPITRWNPKMAASGVPQEAYHEGVVAELGSFSLEFTRLSQLTGDMRYFTLAQRITDIFEKQQNQTALPGMWPVHVNIAAPLLTTGTGFSLGAMADSTFEYFGKMYALLGGMGPAPQYEKLYRTSMDAAIQHLLFRPMVPDNADILMSGIANVNYEEVVITEPASQHLGCFVGGMLALGGRLFKNDSHVEYGRKVTEGCVWAYRNSPHGVMPEWFHMTACPSKEPCEWNETAWQEGTYTNPPKGFQYIDDPRYILRPEAVESVFYMYRITGDPRFQDIAWEMFEAIDKVTATSIANSAIDDVTAETPEKVDSMESFLAGRNPEVFLPSLQRSGLHQPRRFCIQHRGAPVQTARDIGPTFGGASASRVMGAARAL